MLFYIIFSCQFKLYASEMLKLYLKVPRNGRTSFFALIMPSTKDIHQREGNKKKQYTSEQRSVKVWSNFYDLHSPLKCFHGELSSALIPRKGCNVFSKISPSLRSVLELGVSNRSCSDFFCVSEMWII
jgi:hypothetical protein